MQYPDASSRDRLLEERYDALLAKYGKNESQTNDSAAAGSVAEEPEGKSPSALISLPSAVRHDFEKELAALQRDWSERGVRVGDLAARRRATTHASTGGSFWKSLFANRHRDTARSRRLRKCDSGVSLDARRPPASRSRASSSSATRAAPPGAPVRRRSTRLAQSDRRTRDKLTQQSDDLPDRIVLVSDEVAGTPPKRALRRSSQSNVSPLANNSSQLQTSVTVRVTSDNDAQELVEFDREPSIRIHALSPRNRPCKTNSTSLPEITDSAVQSAAPHPKLG